MNSKPITKSQARQGRVALAVVSAGLVLSPHASTAQTLLLNRDLAIGAVEGAPHLQFQRISAIGVISDGTLFVADGGSSSIRVFDGTGKFIRQWGRRGRGPGEFQSVSRMLFRGDTVFTVDTRQMRVTAFAQDGTVRQTWPIGGTSLNLAIAFAAVDGGWLMQAANTPREWVNSAPSVGTVRQLTTHIGVANKLGAAPDSLRRVVSYQSQRWMAVHVRGVAPQLVIPLFEPQPNHAADYRGHVYVNRDGSYRVDVLDSHGKTVRSLTRRHVPVPVTSAQVTRFRAQVNAHYDTTRGGPQAAVLAQARAGQLARAELLTPRTIPPAGRIMVSAGGVVWVERLDLLTNPVDEFLPSPPPQARPWDVFNANGVFIGTAELPARFSLRVVTENEVVGVERDEFDVEYVVRYKFR
ncbi:MAG: 6-bladed beta-propeller [Gemmatimonadota bacterium]